MGNGEPSTTNSVMDSKKEFFFFSVNVTQCGFILACRFHCGRVKSLPGADLISFFPSPVGQFRLRSVSAGPIDDMGEDRKLTISSGLHWVTRMQVRHDHGVLALSPFPHSLC